MFQNNEGVYKYRSQATFIARDKTIFKDVDVQNPATEVLFNGLAARTAYEDMQRTPGKKLLEQAYEAILFQPPLDQDQSTSAATEYIVYFSPVNRNNRWCVRCGKIDYTDLPISAATVGQTPVRTSSSAASSSSGKSPAKPPKESSKTTHGS